jgi:transmembrane sensor
LTKEKEIPGLEAYFQSEDSNTEWIGKLFEDEKNEPDLKRDLRFKWFGILKTTTPQIDLKHILYKIHFDINSKERSSPVSKTRQLYNQISKIAVILLLPLLALSIYLMVNMAQESVQISEIVAPKGEKAQFILPDGSSGYLNSGSTLKYAYPFNKNRLVELTGEGYFNVVHDKNLFTVQAHDMRVEVHGTRFNVCAYNDDADIITTLEEGSVSVIRDVDGKSVTIEPGQQAVFNRSNNQIAKKKVDVDPYVSWKDNMLRFQNAPFADVVKKMERWYDVKIVLDEDLQYSQRYTMTIKTESLREMLDLMIVTTPMKYKIKEDIVYITHQN